MDTIVFFDYGIEIIWRNGEYLIRYDAGEIVPKIVEAPVTIDQVNRAKRGEDEAYKVLLEVTPVK